MINNIFNYKVSEDKEAAVQLFIENQPVKTTVARGVAASALTYLVGFAASRMVVSAETRFTELRFDRALVKAATKIANGETI